MDFPELLHDDGPTPETHGPYLSQHAIPDPVSVVNMATMPVNSGLPGTTEQLGNTGSTDITTHDRNTFEPEVDSITTEPGGVVPKTVKLPVAVFASIDREWPTRSYPSFHAYCVSVLSRHNELHEASAIIEQYKVSIQKLTDSNIRLQSEFDSYIVQAKSFQEQLTATISQLTSENEKLRNSIEQSAQTIATQAVSSQTQPMEPDQYHQEAEDLKRQNIQLHSALEQYTNLFETISRIVGQVCLLSAAESFRTPDYFMGYFNELLKPHLPR